jgi:GST-like protein
MIDLYSWPTPNGHKVHIMLEETGLAYKVHPVNIRAGEQFEPGFLAISPNNRIPAMVDSDGPDGGAYSLFESGAILVYLAGKAGKLLPKSVSGKYDVLQWVMFQMASVGPMMGQANHFRSNAAPERIEYAINRYTSEVIRQHGVMEKRLARSKFIGGDQYSIADIAIWPWLRASERNGVNWAEFPRLKAWFDLVGARPAVQRGVQVLADRTTPPGQYDPKAREILFGKTQFEKR